MTAEIVMDIFRQGAYIALVCMVVLISPSLIVGLVIAFLQAATQINEMSLNFLPKLIATFVGILITGPWLLNMIMDYTNRLMIQIPTLIR